MSNAILTESQFRADFPEFADTTKYPPSMFNFWYGLVINMLNSRIWGKKLIQAQELLTAHFLVLAAMNLDDANADSDPGRATAPVSSLTVGGVSVSFDVSASLQDAAGTFNETSYGRQLWTLMRLTTATAVFII